MRTYYLAGNKKVFAAVAAAALLFGPLSALADASAPSVTVASTAPDPTGDNPIVFTVTLSDPVSDFDAADVSVEGGQVVNFSGSGTSYSFGVHPGDGDPLHDSQERLVTVRVNEHQFSNNQGSNVVTRWYDPESPLTQPADTTAPVITITVGPAEGSQVATADASTTSAAIHFEFTVNDASSTLRCSIGDATAAPSYFGCGSPQDYTLPAGSYLFAVDATDPSNNVASSTRTFSIALGTTTPTATTTPPEPTPTPAPAPSGGGGGGGGGGGSGGNNGQIVGSGPSAPSAPGTLQSGFANPNPIIPQLPTALSPSPVVVPVPEPVVTVAPAAPVVAVSGTAPRSTARLTASSQPTAAETIAPTTESTSTTPAVTTPAVDTSLQGAAAATAPDVPTSAYVWGAIIILALIAAGWFFYRTV